ncbi:unnamed protein product [Acanthoscelides obtectus]|uniref:Uncharacterized protein n=1 Tax=Acanthoscelides obtectus TaxID=200917 RepID=A0A9P0KP39_ACAOB|nr:unnamed protein product [Acanthoscelides obtectus]CAK1666636.1 hypothetical protein AOBTE_LOCUS25413 [Acanthoscelides obtectus]
MDKADLSEEQRQKLRNHHKECSAETKVDEELVKKARQGDFANDEKLKDHILCVVKKIGIIDDAGDIKTDVMKAKVGSVVGEEQAEKLIKECALKKADARETAFEMVKCSASKSGKNII